MDASISQKRPAALETALTVARIIGLQTKRSLLDISSGGVRRWKQARDVEGAILSEISAPIKGEEATLHNLRVGAQLLNGVLVPQDKLFSFWAQIGRPTLTSGFMETSQRREIPGTPSLFKELCHLADAIHKAAQQAECEIVERHGGRRTAVFWNFIDLRFRPSQPLIINVQIKPEQILVRFIAA